MGDDPVAPISGMRIPPGWEQTDATIDLADLAAHADRLADCLEALIRNRKPHTHWLDEGLDALIAYRDATS